MIREIKMLKDGQWVRWDYSDDVEKLLIEEEIILDELKNRIPKFYLYTRIKDGVRQFHKSYRELSEVEIIQIPDKYWDDDLPRVEE